MECVILISTYPDEEKAVNAARLVLEARLAACVNITKIRSLYHWEGKIEDSGEYLAIFKTLKRSARRLKKVIAENHPYKVPEIVEVRMDASKSYFDWMNESISSVEIQK